MSEPVEPQPETTALPETQERKPRGKSRLADTRVKIALGLAVLEGIVIVLEEDFSRITAVIIAVPIVIFHLLAGRTLESRTLRDISWTLALSQVFAVLVVILAELIDAFALVLIAVFAALALYLLWYDKPVQKTK